MRKMNPLVFKTLCVSLKNLELSEGVRCSMTEMAQTRSSEFERKGSVVADDLIMVFLAEKYLSTPTASKPCDLRNSTNKPVPHPISAILDR